MNDPLQLMPEQKSKDEDSKIEPGTLMAGKKGLVMGVANERSIAWGIAKAVHNQGAELAFSFQGDALKKRVDPLADSLGSDFVVPCDVTEPSSMDAVFAAIKERWGQLDFLVHAIAFSDKDELKGQYIDTTPDNFASTMNISCYSFTALCQRARPLMTDGGSLLTLTYFGAERVMPHYNVMGIAKAALEASVRYLAEDLGRENIRVNAVNPVAGDTPLLASFMGEDTPEQRAQFLATIPLGRFSTPEDIAGAACYLCSDEASLVTGVCMEVDGGRCI